MLYYNTFAYSIIKVMCDQSGLNSTVMVYTLLKRIKFLAKLIIYPNIH